MSAQCVLPGMPYTTREFKLMCVRECAVEFGQLDNAEKAYQFWQANVPSAPWYLEEREIMIAITVNIRRRVTGFSLQGIGTLEEISLHPRDIFRMAVVQNASALVLIHSHPSGDCTPSEADIRTTLNLISAGQLLKIEVLDHVVVGAAGTNGQKAWFSLREAGYFN